LFILKKGKTMTISKCVSVSALLVAMGMAACAVEDVDGESEAVSSTELTEKADIGPGDTQQRDDGTCASDPDACASSVVAAAAVDDSFRIPTTDGCGRADFVDFGPGVPGNSTGNDDYVNIRDLCADGHGVRAFARLFRGTSVISLGSLYNGNGNGGVIVWDPFLSFGNVVPNDVVELTICLVDGPNDATGARCGIASRRSVDG
jgi:hypothetical protein